MITNRFLRYNPYFFLYSGTAGIALNESHPVWRRKRKGYKKYLNLDVFFFLAHVFSILFHPLCASRVSTWTTYTDVIRAN